MNDPLSPLTAPPPRYLLESDSSDEEGQGAYPSSSSHRHPPPDPLEVRLTWTGAKGSSYDEVALGIGQAGRYILRKSGLGGVHAALRIEVIQAGRRRMVGEGKEMEGGKGLILSIGEEGDHGAVWAVAEELTKAVKTKNWTILSTHVPAMYIPDPDSELIRDVVPIRYLGIAGPALDVQQAKEAGLYKFDSPNYVTGLAGALANMAVHPAYSLEGRMIILSLPLPLSSISDKPLLLGLEAASPMTGEVSRRAIGAGGGHKHGTIAWAERDDEVFSGLGMGGGSRAKAGRVEKVDVGPMYM